MNSRFVLTDDPITHRHDDLLGRADLADMLGHSVLELDASKGLAVGIHGTWGSGKTSLMNLIVEALREQRECPMVFFNPWFFSGIDDLAVHFFEELTAQLRRIAGERDARVAEVVSALEGYGGLLAPLRLLPMAGPLSKD